MSFAGPAGLSRISQFLEYSDREGMFTSSGEQARMRDCQCATTVHE